MENDIFDALEIDYLTILQIFQLDIIKSIRIQFLQKSSRAALRVTRLVNVYIHGSP